MRRESPGEIPPIRLDLRRREPLLDQVEPFQVGLQVQHRSLQQQLGGGARPGLGQARVEIAQGLEVFGALRLDQRPRVGELPGDVRTRPASAAQ